MTAARTRPASPIDLMDLTPWAEDRDAEVFAQLRAAGRIFWNDEAGGAGFWNLVRYDDVRDAASDAPRLSSEDGTQIVSRRAEGALHSLHNMDDPEHAKLRKIATPHLRAVSVRRWQEVIDEVVTQLLDDAATKVEFDLVEVVAARLPMLVLARVLGVPAADAPRMVDWTNRLTSADPDAFVDTDALAATRHEIMDYFRWLTEERRAAPTGDLVSVLATATKDGVPLTWDELAAYYVVLVAAGNETTRALISGGVAALSDNPDQRRRLSADPDLIPSAVEEMFRYVSPIGCMRRTALEDMTLAGQEIAAGDKVVLWFGSANRDEAVFEDADAFRLDRSPNPHLTFGWGVHACLGAHLARAEVITLLRSMGERRMAFDRTAPVTRLRHNLFRGWTSVPVRLVDADRA